MNTTNSTCRLCLSETAETEFDIYEDRVHIKIISLLQGLLFVFFFNSWNLLIKTFFFSVEVSPDDCLPSYICRQCRIQLDKFYIFRFRSVESDKALRSSLPQDNRYDEAVHFLNRHDGGFNEHDYEPPATKRAKGNPKGELTEEECTAIEKTVQAAMRKNGYFGKFVLKVENTDEKGLRKIRVIKDNGSVILMKLKMPERAVTEKAPKPQRKRIEIHEQLEVLLKKCEKVETTQDKLLRTAYRTEKTVMAMNERLHTTSDPFEMNEAGRDSDASFYFPIIQLSELWRLNTRLAEPETKSQLSEEMSKIEAPPNGSKISAKIFRTVIGRPLLGQLSWSGRIKEDSRYIKSEEKLMLSKMKFLVDWMYGIVAAKEPETDLNMFLQTIMNIIRKERFSVRKGWVNSF